MERIPRVPGTSKEGTCFVAIKGQGVRCSLSRTSHAIKARYHFESVSDISTRKSALVWFAWDRVNSGRSARFILVLRCLPHSAFHRLAHTTLSTTDRHRSTFWGISGLWPPFLPVRTLVSHPPTHPALQKVPHVTYPRNHPHLY